MRVSWGWGARFSESIAAGCQGPFRRSATSEGSRGVRRPGPRAMRAAGARGEATRPDILRVDAAVIREALADGARRLVGGEDTLAGRRDGLRVLKTLSRRRAASQIP